MVGADGGAVKLAIYHRGNPLGLIFRRSFSPFQSLIRFPASILFDSGVCYFPFSFLFSFDRVKSILSALPHNLQRVTSSFTKTCVISSKGQPKLSLGLGVLGAVTEKFNACLSFLCVRFCAVGCQN